jgi:general secretion pathway protein G
VSLRPDGRASGMTYVELLVVAVVAGVLATVAIPTGHTIHRGFQERQLKRSVARIRAAIDAYHLDWENGCIESEDEKGWPRDLQELTEDKDLADDPECRGEDPAKPKPTHGAQMEEPEDRLSEPKPPPTRKYLARIPPDPFNSTGDEYDTAGWKARSYDDEPDSTSWKGEGLYDVYSASNLTAMDGSKYAEW